MAENVVFGFLGSIDENPQEAEKPKRHERHAKSRKKGIADVENAFLTVGGGQVVEETDEPEEAWKKGDDAAATDPPPEPGEKAPGVQKTQAYEKPAAKPQAPAQKKNEPSKVNNTGAGGDLTKKLNEIILGQTRIMESLDQLKNASRRTATKEDADALKESILQSLEELTAKQDAVFAGPLPNDTADKADPLPDAANLSEEKDDSKKQEETIDFAKIIESLGQQVSEKDNEIAALKEENSKLKADNQKLKKAVIEKILSNRTNGAQPQAMAQGSQSVAPTPVNMQGMGQMNGTQHPQAPAPRPMTPQQGLGMSPAAPQMMPQGPYQQVLSPQNPAQSSIWGNDAPPAVDLLAEEEPKKKKKGLFGKKK